jgi:hypothetical protein
MFRGKKTFIVAGATAAYAALGFALGHLDAPEALRLILESGMIAALRDAIRG